MRLTEPEDLVQEIDKTLGDFHNSLLTMEELGLIDDIVAKTLHRKLKKLLALERTLDEELESRGYYETQRKVHST